MRKLLSVCLLLIATFAFASDVRHVEDASLRSVFFIDPQEGWIVGDEGIILHTIDGGKRWERQPTGTRASLRSVQFLTPFIGWAAGREELPYGQGSVGVILFTSDGGLEWKKQLPNTLPGLNAVRFADPKTGYLCGDGCDQFPFGVFKTTDSGKTWEPVPGPRTTSWLAADFFDRTRGVLVGAWGRLAVTRKDESSQVFTLPTLMGGAVTAALGNKQKAVVAEHADWLAGRDITSVQILGKKTIAVGQGGLILTSTSEGKAWGFADTKLPTKVLANLDFHTVHSVKEKIWIAGRPGSAILHSDDGGTTWKFQKTGQTLPLHSVFFFDEYLGFAVGDAGTILRTTDGGRTWATQHQGGKRAAALCVHSLNKNMPVDTLARIGAADGYLATSLRITAPDPAMVTWGREQDERRYAAAARLAGALNGETLWHFPMPEHLEGSDKKTILAHWNQIHKTGAEDELLRQLVLAIRIGRPNVIVTEPPTSKHGLSALLGEAVQEAVARAGDLRVFPEQIEYLGLSPWTVARVCASVGQPLSPGGARETESSDLRQDNDASNARLQMTIRDHANIARALVSQRCTALPKERGYAILTGRPEKGALPHLLADVEARVGDCKRDFKIDDSDTKLAQAMLQQRSAIAMADNIEDPVRAMKLIPPALDKLPDEQAAFAAFAIASRYAERGQWHAAQEFYLYVADRAPAHPLAVHAYRWLLAFNTSSEARRRSELKHFAITEPIALLNKKGALVDEKIVPAGHIVPAGNEVVSRTDVRDWNKGSAEWTKRLASFGAVHAFDVRAQFCLQAARRNLGDVGASVRAMDQFRKFIPSGPWHEAARSEVWFTNRTDSPPRLGRVRYTEVRPFLDGKFDDPCWKDVKPMLLDNAVGDTAKQYTTEAMFAFDQEFLYVALKCTHPEGKRLPPVKPRPRDADVDAFDRVSLLFDLDRDYATYFHLEVDQRGCVRDSCWGDRNWNPKWFVAVHSSDTAWHIEAAIPLSELTGQPIAQQTAWAFNVVRVLPGRGVQSWSLPADVTPRPEGMSLLMFDHGKARAMPAP